MRKFILSLCILTSALLVLCCCANGGEETSSEASENSALSEESSALVESLVSTEISGESADSSMDETDTVENSSEEESSTAEDSSAEDTSTQAPPVESEQPPKEQETIPDLFLEPQPEGEYHTLYVGESMQLYSGIVGSEIEDAMLKWTVSDNTVIRFSAKSVTALTPGTATVTLSYSNGLKPVSITFVVIENEEISADE